MYYDLWRKIVKWKIKIIKIIKIITLNKIISIEITSEKKYLKKCVKIQIYW